MPRSADHSPAPPGADHSSVSPDTRPWWYDALFYGVDLPFFADSDADGIGDLDGVRSRVGYLELLGVDALWLTGVPMTGAGPTITDPGEAATVLEAFELLAAETHDCGLRLALDVGADLTRLDDPREQEELAETLRFWIGRGVDGFRIASTAPRSTIRTDSRTGDVIRAADRMVRSVIDEHPGRIMSALTSDPHGHGWHLSFDQHLADAAFDAEEFREAITQGMLLVDKRSTQPAWMSAGRWQLRPVTRYGGGELGHARARAMALLVLALPGMVCLDSGEELGLPELAPSESAPGSGNLRNGRAPMPWEGSGPTFGFTSTAWPGVSPDWAHLTVEAQLEDATSTLSLYREALDIRRTHDAFHGTTIEWYGAPPGCLAFRRGSTGLTCAINTSGSPVPLPPGELLLASAPLTGSGELPADTAVWLA
ncbi:uncharacterized protein DUF3459 [Halopolyspora algeriensis]|uniref:Uncharacterized protein DUF3459 n=1 Tax=Halopolyspora algeriensis TaxID=1500506 RepID=A0A368VSX5_9ACTN|nr:DUF3459 domain-containing protein [Halopolyspora algeriensis]RCW45112.1 uncharacterized protein DUF3459 [Halopolyspora algeriensis]TQM53166.1 uncharacterized protein DUF3459 [Halopolyspora algeriensis]